MADAKRSDDSTEAADGINVTRLHDRDIPSALDDVGSIPHMTSADASSAKSVMAFEARLSDAIGKRQERLAEIRSRMSERAQKNSKGISSNISAPLMRVSETFASSRTLVSGTTVFHRIINRVGSNAELLARRYAPIRSNINELRDRIDAATHEAMSDIDRAGELHALHESEVVEISHQLAAVGLELENAVVALEEEKETKKGLDEGTPEYMECRSRISDLERLVTRLDRLEASLNTQLFKSENAADNMRGVQDGIVSEIDILNQCKQSVSSALQTLEDMAIVDNSKKRLELARGVSVFTERVEISSARQHRAVAIRRATESERPNLSERALKRIGAIRADSAKRESRIAEAGEKQRTRGRALIQKMRDEQGVGESISIEARRQIAKNQQEIMSLPASQKRLSNTTPEE